MSPHRRSTRRRPVRGSLPGPSRTITVEPIQVPATPREIPDAEPAEDPARRQDDPKREPAPAR